MEAESQKPNSVNVQTGHIISGGGGFVIGIVVTLIVAFIIGGIFCPAPAEASEESPAPVTSEDPSMVAQYVYGWLNWWMETYDLDPEAVQADYDQNVANLSEEDAEDLLELYGASELWSEASDNLGDGDFNPFESDPEE